VTDTLRISFRKRVYNSTLIGYSGEVALALWARSRSYRSDAEILHAIKDVNILSAVVSGCGATFLVLLLGTRISIEHLPSPTVVWWAAATILMTIALPAGLLIRRQTLAMSRDQIAAVTAIHGLRFVLGLAFLLVQWWLVLPGAATSSLLVLLAIYVLVGRIPFVPNRDILFMGIALAVSPQLAIGSAALAAVLLTTSALQQVLHLIVFVACAARPEGSR
jgi:hypothetical protein